MPKCPNQKSKPGESRAEETLTDLNMAHFEGNHISCRCKSMVVPTRARAIQN
jgi:hypothetical protein